MTNYIRYTKNELKGIMVLAWKLVRSNSETIGEALKTAWALKTMVISGVRYMKAVIIEKTPAKKVNTNARVALKNAEVVKETAGAVQIKVSVFGNFSFYAEKTISLWFPKSQINLADMTISKWMSDNKKSEVENYFNDGKCYGFTC